MKKEYSIRLTAKKEMATIILIEAESLAEAEEKAADMSEEKLEKWLWHIYGGLKDIEIEDSWCNEID